MTRPLGTVDGAGAVLLGRYELREQLGSGPAGPVWRAQDLLLRRDVALRVLRTSLDRDPAGARERAHRESRAAARFQHPALAAIYDIAELDGDLVLVAELLRGHPLDRVLAAVGPLAAPDVARIGLHLAGGLAVAHAHGVVHGGIGPGTVLVGIDDAGRPDGTAALADLGTARLDLAAVDTAFHAPETAPGAPATASADLWSLGATLGSALAGPSAAGPLAPLLGALLAPDPAARPDADQAHAALEAVLDALEPADGAPEHDPGRHRVGPSPTLAQEAVTAPQRRVATSATGATGATASAGLHPPTRTWTPRVDRRSRAPRRRLVSAGVLGAAGLLAAGGVGVVATSMSTSAPTVAATTAAPGPAVLPGPAPAVAPPITTPDPGPAITAVPMDGDPVLTAATEDSSRSSDRGDHRGRDSDDDDRGKDGGDRKERSDRDDDRGSDGDRRSNRDSDRSDRSDRSERDSSERGDSDGDSDRGSSDDD